MINNVVPGSPADGKLEAGDLVLGINNTRVSRMEDFVRYLEASATVQPTTVHVIRGGTALRIELPILLASD